MWWLLATPIAASVSRAEERWTTVKVGVMTEGGLTVGEMANHAKLAMKHANSDGVLAPWNVSVDMKFHETKGSIGGALASANELLKDRLVVGIVGTEKSLTTEPAAQIATLRGKPILSPLSSASYLIDKDENGVEMLFRSMMSDRLRFKVFAHLAQLYEWRQVGAIAPRNYDGYAAVDALEKELEKVNVTLGALGMFELDEKGSATDIVSVLRGVREVGVHVFALLTEEHTSQVVRGLADVGLLRGTNAFVGFDIDVIPKEILVMLEGWLFVRARNTVVADNFIAERFARSYAADASLWNCSRAAAAGDRGRASLAEDPTVWDFGVALASTSCADGDGVPQTESGFYDAAWVMVLALRRVLESGREATDGRALRDELLKTDWYGVRSYHAFDPESQDALGALDVVNVVDDNATIATVLEVGDDFYRDPAACACFLRRTANVTWPPGNVRPGPPKDGRQISATKSGFVNAIEVYDKLGNATATVKLSSHFEAVPDYGTLLSMQLVDRSGVVEGAVAWNGTYEAPGGVNSTQIPIVIPDWGTYALLATDLYENSAFQELPITASQPECAADDEGYDEATGECVTCTAGREKVGNVCTDCQPGRYRAAGSAWSSCLICDSSQYQPEYGSPSCYRCPPNTTRYDYDFQFDMASRGYSSTKIEDLLGVSIEQCLCRGGYYAKTGPWKRDKYSVDAKTAGAEWGDNGTSCKPCPTGAKCRGKTYAPVNKNQYWGDPRNPVAFEPCDQARCARNYRCKAGYRGRLCSRLRTYKFFTIGGITRRCWFVHSWGISVLVYIVLFCAVLALWVWVNLFLDSSAITIFVQHIQSLAIISQFGVEYPRRPIAYFGILFNFALFDADIVTPSCVFKWSQLSTFYLSIFIALLGLVFYVEPIIELVRNLIRNDSLRHSYFGGVPITALPYRLFVMLRVEFSYYRGSVGQETARATANALSLLDAIYPNLCFNFMRMLTRDKDEASRVYYTRMDATLRWGSPRHVPAAIIAAVGCALVVIGLPAGVFFTVRNNYKLYCGVHELPSLERWGWAYANFRSPYHATAIMTYIQTIAFCAVATYFRNSSLQTVLALVISVTAFTYVATVLPFENFRYNVFTIFAELTVLLFVGTSVLVEERGLRGAWTAITAVEIFVFLVATVLIYVMERAEVLQRAKIKSRMGRIMKLTKHRSINWKSTFGLVEVGRASSPSSFFAKVLDKLPLGSGDDENRKLPRGKHERAVIARALDVLSRAVEPCCMLAWCYDPSCESNNEKKDLVQSVARASESILHASSPLSQYSADHKAAFWRSLTENYRGIVGFAANTLTYSERIVVFGVLVKLQRFLANMTLDELAMDDIIVQSHRSSVLYCLMSAQADDDSLAQFLRDALDAKQRATPPVCIERTVLLPASILRYVKTNCSGEDDDPRVRRLNSLAASTRATIDESNQYRTNLMLVHGRERRSTDLRGLAQHRHRKLVEFDFREEAAIFHIEQFNTRASSMSVSDAYSPPTAGESAHCDAAAIDEPVVDESEETTETRYRAVLATKKHENLRRGVSLEVIEGK
ncbi:hypothetical protein CTAYLR_000902 [Chrysophaeum taylorii]|uniref:Receptor ligand binding region domain-containing protein n=1 Tax=Chrysophaeum taylorii TaxID=2483200 RepID=A0AAD7XQ01_9STRA|nr:hypothetical protein CTAYLR_000902 [Chrysophaeum taylorii]